MSNEQEDGYKSPEEEAAARELEQTERPNSYREVLAQLQETGLTEYLRRSNELAARLLNLGEHPFDTKTSSCQGKQ